MNGIPVGPQYRDVDDEVLDYLSQQGLKRFTEFRADGWPLCPNCGEDELWCPGLVAFYNYNQRVPTVQECIRLGLRCYRCQSEFPSSITAKENQPIMAKCDSIIKELRFVIEELTHVFIFCEAVGDCPLGVQGWHYKAFPASVSAMDVLTMIAKGEEKYLLWPLNGPARD